MLESNKKLKSISSFWFPRPYDENCGELLAAENNWIGRLRGGRNFEVCLLFKVGANLDIKTNAHISNGVQNPEHTLMF